MVFIIAMNYDHLLLAFVTIGMCHHKVQARQNPEMTNCIFHESVRSLYLHLFAL